MEASEVRELINMKPIKYKNVKENLYLIDEYGNIYSNHIKKFLIPTTDKDGYLKIKLSGGSRNNQCYVRVATLVAYHFIGNPPKDMKNPTVNHIDGNKKNNHYTNLEWLERNINTSIRNNKGAGEANHEAKLTEQQVLEICDLLINTNLTYDQIGIKYGVKKSTISNIKNKKNWKYITEKYDFSCRQIANINGKFTSVNLNLVGGLK